MTWGFSLLGALQLQFPGFCAWFGLRSGSRKDYLSPVSDKANSTYTLFVVVLGALFARTIGASLFALQEVYCRFRPCFLVESDPDVYRAILLHDQALAGSGTGIALSLVFFIVLGGLIGAMFERFGASAAPATVVRPEIQGWVRSIAAGAAEVNQVVTALVLTKTGNARFFVAYEGVVQQITLDEDHAVAMIVLAGVDRFLVEIANGTMRRLGTETRSMPLMQILKAEIANVAFEIIDLSALLEQPSEPPAAALA